nr:glycosyltransferase family 4 protein [uncultured Rhodoferax sp.]
MATPRVLCFQQRLTHYRETFFQQAREQLAAKGIAFDLVYGQPDAAAQVRNDSGHLPWANSVQETTIRLGNTAAIWVPTPKGIAKPDLVIVTQENKLLANYAWLLRRLLGGPKVAYWGHGINFQSDAPTGLRERWKRFLLTRVDWWFAYTQMTVDLLTQANYPAAQTTCLNNAIDNAGFKADLASVTFEDLNSIRQQLDLGPATPLGLFCGSLYQDKRIDLMVQAADSIRAAVSNFCLVVIGDGPSAADIRRAAQSRPWLHCVGVKKGRDKAMYFRLASVVLNPGAVGLHVLDSFVSGVPMATMADARHGPEVAYLEHGVNGLNVSGGIAEYAENVIKLLSDNTYLTRIRSASSVSAEKYTLNNMVENFVQGIEQCLNRFTR